MNEQETDFDWVAIARESDRLRNFLINHAGEDVYFDTLLGRPSGDHPPYARNGREKDRQDIFRGIVHSLTQLLGTEEAAARWLFHDAVFKQTVGSVPFDYLESGDFWALLLLHDCLEIRVKECPNGTTAPLPTLR